MRAGIWTAVLLALIDQTSKTIILTFVMKPPRIIEITEHFNLVLVWNRGVSFGMLKAPPSGGLFY